MKIALDNSDVWINFMPPCDPSQMGTPAIAATIHFEELLPEGKYVLEVSVREVSATKDAPVRRASAPFAVSYCS